MRSSQCHEVWMSRWNVAVLLVFVAMAVNSSSDASTPSNEFSVRQVGSSGRIVRALPRDVILEFEENVGPSERTAVGVSVGAVEMSALGTRGLFRITLQEGHDPFDAADALDLDSRVYAATACVIGELETLPNDPALADWWFTDAPVADELANYFAEYQGSEDVVVVLMDTGLDVSHIEYSWSASSNSMSGTGIYLFPNNYTPELDPNPIPGFSVSTSPRDLDGHGTAMAGYIKAAANNGVLVAGLAYQNPLWVMKVGYVDPSNGGQILEPGAVFQAIDDLIDLIEGGATSQKYVVNMSFGWVRDALTVNNALTLLHDRIAALEATGRVLVVAATGNQPNALYSREGISGCQRRESDPDMSIKYPAAFSGDVGFSDFGSVIAVGAYRLANYQCQLPPSEAQDCPCDCEPMTSSSVYVRSEFSRYRPPVGGGQQPACTPIVDILAPGGRTFPSVSSSSADCGRANMLAPSLPTGFGPGNDDQASWSAGTSDAAAITSAVAAGMWSRDPMRPPSYIKRQLMLTASKQVHDVSENFATEPLVFLNRDLCANPPEVCDDPGPEGDCMAFAMPASPVEAGPFDVSGQAGHGLLAPYRALAAVDPGTAVYLSPGLLASSATYDQDDVFLAGPIEVDEGVTLELGRSSGPAQRVHLAGDAYLKVSGHLRVVGKVVFSPEQVNGNDQRWLGIVVSQTGSIEFLDDVTIERAGVGIACSGVLTAPLDGLTVRQCSSGLIWLSDSQLLLGQASFEEIGGVGLYVLGAAIELAGPLVYTGDGHALDVVGGVLNVNEAGSLHIDGGLGIRVTGAQHGGVIRHLSVLNCVGIPLAYTGGDLDLGPNVTIAGSGVGLSGISLTGSGVVRPVGTIAVADAGLHGVAIYDMASADDWTGLQVSGCAGDGLHVDGSSVGLSGTTSLKNNAGAGLWVDGQEATLTGVDLSDNVGNGITFVGSVLELYSCRLSGSLNGVVSSAENAALCGRVGAGNDFTGVVEKYIVNLNQGVSVVSRGNTFDTCPPLWKRLFGGVDDAGCQ